MKEKIWTLNEEVEIWVGNRKRKYLIKDPIKVWVNDHLVYETNTELECQNCPNYDPDRTKDVR